MTSQSDLYPVKSHGWRRGLGNLTNKENRAWWRTKKWWVQSLIWLVVINGIFGLILWVAPESDPEQAIPTSEAADVFIIIFSAFATIGVIVLNQSAIIGEKQSGTAEWILSNPVSRAAFILSKLIANGVAIFLIIVVLQSLVFYLQLSLHNNGLLEAGPLIAAMALVSLNLLFFLTLTLMLGTFFNSRLPVTGIAIIILFGQDIIAIFVTRFWEGAKWYFPQSLLEMAQAAVNGQELPSLIPVIIFPVISILFILAAIWRFEREEF